MKKIVSILGSTGSIGLSTLKIIDKKKDFFKINLLSANKNYKLILSQIKKYKPNYFVVSDHNVFLKVKKNKYKGCKVLNNFKLIKFKKKNDIIVSAIPGIKGLEPTILFIKKTKKLLIANKESIVCGWDIIKKLSKKHFTSIIPLDSEHFSLSKLLSKHKMKDIKNFYITASGGPFLKYNLKNFKNITPYQALKHPTWKMGKKISVDSSTLMNKMLELVEAQKLFSIPNKKLNIIIHPNSLVHAIVELNNGLFEFIYHDNTMIIPIANAMLDDKIEITKFYNSKKTLMENHLIFKKVDPKRFPLISLKKKMNIYPSSSIIFNAANEVAVDQFLKGKLPYLGISKIIMSILKDRNFKKNAVKKPINLNQIININNWAKKVTSLNIEKSYD